MIAFPADLNEQAALEAELDEIEAQTLALEACYQAQLAELADLKKSLFHRAFSGALTAFSN